MARAHQWIRTLGDSPTRDGVLAVPAAGLAALLGVAVTAKGVAVPIACSALILAPAAWWVIQRYRTGPLVAILLFVGCGLAPGINNRNMVAQGIEIGDVASAILIGLLLFENFEQRFRGFENRAVRWVGVGCALLFIWWGYVVLHTMVTGTPLLQALRTGRDFGLFSIAFPLAAAAFTDERLRMSFIATTAFLLVPAALGQAAAATVKPSLIGSVVHTVRENTPGAVARLDTDADDLYCLAFLMAAFALLLRPNRVPIWVAILLLTLASSYVLFTFTRGRYLALPIALVLGALATNQRRRITLNAIRGLAVGGLVIAAVTATPVGPKIAPVADAFAGRIGSLDQAPTASEDTVSVRASIAARVSQKLDQEDAWIAGLGFRSANSNYDPTFPGGSLRNPDIGVLNAISTMGLVGCALLLGVCALAVVRTFQFGRRAPEGTRWLLFASGSYGLFAFLSSPTLSALVTSRGLLVTALALGLGIGVAGQFERQDQDG